MFLITANSFATVGIDNSNTILSMPIIKIIIVVVAGIIIVTLLYNMSQDSSSSAKELIKQMEKNENNKQYSNEYNKKNKNNVIDKKIIEKANEPEKPKVREEYIRESKLDQGLLEEITDLYNKDSKKEDIFDLEDSNEYNIVIAFANNPVLFLKNKNFEMILKNLLQEIYNSKINISIELNRNDIEILREKKLKEEEQYENDKKEISRNYILQNALNRENREKDKEQEEDKLQEKTNISNNMSTNAENNKKQNIGKSDGSSNGSISSNTIEKKTGTDKEKKYIFGRMPYGKEVPVVKVKGIHENLGDIIIVGEIIDKEIREIREDLSLASYAVYDGTSSIMVKKFLKKAEIEDVEKRIKEHMSQNGLFKIYGKSRI